MPEPAVYQMTSNEFPGYGAVIAGNFAEINRGGINSFSAYIQAFKGDRNLQYQRFDTLEAAISWILETAPKHQGIPNPRANTERWEAYGECSLSAERTDTGEYQSHWYPMKVNSEQYPYISTPRSFATPEEAIEDARSQADEWLEGQREFEAEMLDIKKALTRIAICGPDEGEVLPYPFTDEIRRRIARQHIAGASISQLAKAWGRHESSIRIILEKFPNG